MNFTDEAYLAGSLPDAEKALMDLIPEETQLNHNFSRKFQRKMQKLLRYERRSPFARVMAQVGKAAVIVLVVAAVVNTVLLCSVSAYRERFVEMIKIVAEECTTFIMNTQEVPSGEVLPLEPALPNGFSLTASEVGQKYFYRTYEDDQGRYIHFFQEVLGNSVASYDTENAQVSTVALGETEVWCITKGPRIQIIWQDEDALHDIVGNASYAEMLQAAKSMIS